MNCTHQVPQVSYQVPQVPHQVPQVPHQVPQVPHPVPQVSYQVPQVPHQVTQVPHVPDISVGRLWYVESYEVRIFMYQCALRYLTLYHAYQALPSAQGTICVPGKHFTSTFFDHGHFK
ncbi:hypothetical protein FHG87_024272 [Trinorchestia longiramus]|nr:hypothetical protein FHG87_024272 [Trinorchestia longiramus]